MINSFVRWQITSRGIAIFFASGILAASLISLAISMSLANKVSSEVKDRELELIFGAVEAGPLAISRLQSAVIAQQELSRLMSNANLKDRGLISAKIKGGANFTFEYAKWNSEKTPPQECLQPTVRSFQFQDAINPFMVEIVRDKCFVVKEERSIFLYSSIASLLIALTSCLLLAISIWPAALSIRRAEALLSNNASGGLHLIPFVPIRSLVKKALKSIELEGDAALSRIATQVSHDIRSPLSALNIVISTLNEVPSEKRDIIKNVSERINQIANDLLQNRKVEQLGTSAELEKTLNSVVAEKRLQLKNRPEVELKFDPTLSGTFTISLDATTLSRIVSNLVENAVEAIEGAGDITVAIRNSASELQISVIDTGKGIPADILTKLGVRGASFGKAIKATSGSGLGIWFARETVEKCNGSLNIQSRIGQGTLVQITLPIKN